MQKVINEHKIEYFKSKLFDTYFKDKSLVVFDIESMGLNPKCNEVVLAAFMEVSSDGTAKVTQYLLDSLNEEVFLLNIIRETLNKYDIALTYNGKHFDIPFIKTRSKALGMRDMGLNTYDINSYDLDLYLILHGHSELKRVLPNLKQKTIEEYMGISSSRDDEISGSESVTLFQNYLSENNCESREQLAQKILLHNHDDVLQLYKLLPIIKRTNFHQAMSKLGFPVLDFEISTIKVVSKELQIFGVHRRNDYSYVSFYSNERPYSVDIKRDGTFEIIVPLNKLDNAEILNIRSMGLDETPFNDLPNYINGFLIITHDTVVNNLEVNIFSKEIIKKVLQE